MILDKLNIHTKGFSFQCKREYQQDAILIDKENMLFAVCDGVGGSTDGHFASREVISIIQNELLEYFFNAKTRRDYYEIMMIIQDNLYQAASQNNLVGVSSTTLALLHIKDNVATLINVGDSKIFYLSKSHENFVTKDHSIVQELFEAGVLKTEDEKQAHPMRNRITSSLNTNDEPFQQEMGFHQIENVSANDYFILCSDGAVEEYTDSRLFSHFSSKENQEFDNWNKFTNQARMSNDNSSAILVIPNLSLITQ